MMIGMSLWEAPPRDVRPIAARERARLHQLLDALTAEEWAAETSATGWTVRDLALHLLQDDLRWLSSRRDEDAAGLIDDVSDWPAFVRLLAANNQDWIDGARSLSRRVVTDLLAWTGRQVETYDASQDLLSQGRVSWASDGPVPFWFNLAQEFTERWVHQQQIREAVGRVDDHEEFLPEVLRTFVWAYPHQFRVAASAGTQVELRTGDVGVWTLTSLGDRRWSLAEQPAGLEVLARLSLAADTAWRLLTGASIPADSVHLEGPPAVTEALQRVRGIIV